MRIKQLPLLAFVAAIIIFSGFTLMSPSGAPAAKTGSPGDGSSCTSCHGGTATTTANCITTTVPASGYVAGTVYSITATNPLTNSGKYGFELSPQNATGTQLGVLAPGTASKLVGGTKYVTHSTSNSTTKVWTFSWTAPAAGTGPVTFYAAFARGTSNYVTLCNLTVQEAASGPAAAGPITGLTAVCLNSSATYSVGTISGATSYVWAAPTGATITSGQGTTSVNVTFGPSAVTGNMSVYGTNGSTNGASSTLAVAVNNTPTQAASITGSTTPCQSTAQTYSVTNVSGVTFTWSVPSGSLIVSGQGTNTVSVNMGPNNGDISVVPSNNCGTAAATTLAVTVSPVAAQTSSITGDSGPCQTSSQTYSVTSVSGVSYAWSVPAGSTITSGQGTNSINVTLGGNSGNVSVVPSNTCGNGPATNLALSVGLVPSQPSSITGSSTSCQSATETYSVTNVAGVTYAWDVPAGATINSGQGTSSINITMGSSSGNVSVTPTNSCGSGAMVSKMVSIGNGPAQTSNITGSASPCQTTTQTYSVTFVSGVDYTWTVPSGSTITSGQGTNSIVASIGASNGNVTVVPSNNCGNGAMTSFPITISPAAAIPSVPVGPDMVDLHMTTSSSYTTSTGDDSYIWRLNPVSAGIITGTTTSGSVSWNASFIGTAEISVKGLNTCGESAWSVVKTTQVINTTGVDVNESGIKVMSGNPAGYITVALNTDAAQAHVMLLDLSGRTLLNTTVPGQGTQKLDYQLKSGVYIIAIEAGSSSLKKKILVM